MSRARKVLQRRLIRWAASAPHARLMLDLPFSIPVRTVARRAARQIPRRAVRGLALLYSTRMFSLDRWFARGGSRIGWRDLQ